MAATLLAGCSGEPEQDNYIAIVNGEGIPEEDYQAQLTQFIQMVRLQYGVDAEEDEELLAELEEITLQNMINRTLLVQESESQGLDVSDAEVEENIEEIKSRYEDDEQFNEALAADGLDIEGLTEMIREDMLIESLIFEITSEVLVSEDDISEKEIEQLYEQRKQTAQAQGYEFPPLEESRQQIINSLVVQKTEEEEQQAIEELIADLTEKSDIEIF